MTNSIQSAHAELGKEKECFVSHVLSFADFSRPPFDCAK